MAADEGKVKKLLERYRYPLLILLLGAALMLLSRGQSAAVDKKGRADDSELRLQELLSAVEGVGETRVLLTESGVLIACSGADSAQTRLEILRAVSVSTGFGSDKIIILKLNGS